MSPYRQSAEIELYVESKAKRFGVIIVPTPPPAPTPIVVAPAVVEHKCQLPKPDVGFKKMWWQVFSKLIDREPVIFKRGDLWRCECGEVYLYRLYGKDAAVIGNHVRNCVHECNTFCDYWVTSSLRVWKENGGEE